MRRIDSLESGATKSVSFSRDIIHVYNNRPIEEGKEATPVQEHNNGGFEYSIEMKGHPTSKLSAFSSTTRSMLKRKSHSQPDLPSMEAASLLRLEGLAASRDHYPHHPTHTNSLLASSSSGLPTYGGMKNGVTGGSKKSNLALFFFMLLAAFLVLMLLFSTFPSLPEEQRGVVGLPRSIKQVQELGLVLSAYTHTHYTHVLLAFLGAYVFLQSFSIPGSIFMSFLGGALFGLPVGFCVVTLAATLGASNSYWLSYHLVGSFVNTYFPSKFERFGVEIEKHRANLFNYFLFLRISPLLPNWFINLASPLLSVPFNLFFLGTLIGIMPGTFICVKAGVTVHKLNSASDVVDANALATLFALALLALLPTWGPVQRLFQRVVYYVSADRSGESGEEGLDDVRTKRKERERQDDGDEKV